MSHGFGSTPETHPIEPPATKPATPEVLPVPMDAYTDDGRSVMSRIYTDEENSKESDTPDTAYKDLIPPPQRAERLTLNRFLENSNGLTDSEHLRIVTEDLEEAFAQEENIFHELVERQLYDIEQNDPEGQIYTMLRETAMAELVYARFLDVLATNHPLALAMSGDIGGGIPKDQLRREIHIGVHDSILDEDAVNILNNFRNIIKDIGANHERLVGLVKDAYYHFRLDFIETLVEKMKDHKEIVGFAEKLKQMGGRKFLDAEAAARIDQGRIPDFKYPNREFVVASKVYTPYLPVLEEIPIDKTTPGEQAAWVLGQKFKPAPGWSGGQLDILQTIVKSYTRPRTHREAAEHIVRLLNEQTQQAQPRANEALMLRAFADIKERLTTDLQHQVLDLFEQAALIYTRPNGIVREGIKEFHQTMPGKEHQQNLIARKAFLDTSLAELNNIFSQQPITVDTLIQRIESVLKRLAPGAKDYQEEQNEVFKNIVESMNEKRKVFRVQMQARLDKIFLQETHDIQDALQSVGGLLNQALRNSFIRWVSVPTLLVGIAALVFGILNYEKNTQSKNQ